MRFAKGTALICFILLGLSINGFGEQARPNLLLQAVKEKDVPGVKTLLADPEVRNHELNPKCPGAICKPIFFAARDGSLPIIKLLIDAGAEVDAQSGNSGDTPLIIASYMHNHKLARLLLKNGADVNKANHFGATPFWGACAMGDYELINLYIAKADVDLPGRYPDPLQKKGEKKQLVERITPLMAASKAGHLEMVRLLVDKGADVRLKDSLGRSAKEYALRFNHHNISDFLNNNLGD